jgi:hypothetical protein
MAFFFFFFKKKRAFYELFLDGLNPIFELNSLVNHNIKIQIKL